jgi:D-aspartate ligase
MQDVIVTGFSGNALSTLRCLKNMKRKHITLWSLGARGIPNNPARYSILPHRRLLYPRKQNISEFLYEQRNRFHTKPLLLLTHDNHVVSINENRQTLKPYYTFIMPSQEVVSNLMEKSSFISLAQQHEWPVPDSYRIESKDELLEIDSKLSYPFIVKGYLRKAMRINNRNELENYSSRLINKNYRSMIVQKWIKGGDDQLFFCFLLFDTTSRLVATFMGRKLRQWPVSYGVTSLGISCQISNLMDQSIKICQTLGVKGYCSIEYKYDAENDIYLIMEPTIGRFNLQIALTQAARVNFPEIFVRCFTGMDVKYNPVQEDNVYWISEWDDFLSYKSNNNRGYNYWGNYFKRNTTVLFSLKDPLPLFLFVPMHVIRLIRETHVPWLSAKNIKRTLSRIVRRFLRPADRSNMREKRKK